MPASPFPLTTTRQSPAVAAAALLRGGGDVATWDASGDTAFELLLSGASRVWVVTEDGRAPLVELKAAAVRQLPAVAARDFLGAGPIGRRIWFYHSLRKHLPEPERRWWDTQERLLREGVLTAGRWEQHLHRFRAHVLPRVHPPDVVRALFEQDGADARREFVVTRWRTAAWRAAIVTWFAGGLHRQTPAVGTLGLPLEARLHAALIEAAPADSPPLVAWLTGSWTGGRGTPRWLTDAGHAALQTRLDALTVVRRDALAPVDAIDLHEAWDTTAPGARPALLANAAAHLRPGGHLLLRAETAPPTPPPGLSPAPLGVADPSPFRAPATLFVAG